MSEDWAAVARAITQRLQELGMRQRELAERSHVSQAIVRELQHNTAQRRRSSRTLEALSVALAWHPQHLTAVLTGRTPRNPATRRWPPRTTCRRGWPPSSTICEKLPNNSASSTTISPPFLDGPRSE